MAARIRERNQAFEALRTAPAVLLEGCFAAGRCSTWLEGVGRAKHWWTHDFSGEQFCLGRAFYTHYEEGKSAAYFAETQTSDALVERYAPGLQDALRQLLAEVLNARVVQRRGWCGPGVHIFPAGEPVAARGGVVHFDIEGLPKQHSKGAITAVLMLQAPASGGGLRVWDVRYSGSDVATDNELAMRSEVVASSPGDVVLIDSYRLHQIEAWSENRDRISATIHAAELGAGVWESWF